MPQSDLSAYENGRRAPSAGGDLLVEFTDEASLLDEVGFRLALSDLLQVDVVSVDALRESIRDRVLREAVAV